MLTYHRGEWKEDTSVSENYSRSGYELTYGNFETEDYMFLGKASFRVEVFLLGIDGEPAKPYQFWVSIGPEGTSETVLVTDTPSLFMLLKEVNPIIQAAIEQEKLEMLEEEHKWKALKYKDELGRAIECEHLG